MANRGAEPTSGVESAVLTVLVFLAALGGVLWAAGQVGALLRTGHGLPTALSAAPALAVGILRHPSAPAGAWPRTVRPSLPSAPVLYGLAAVISAVVAGVTTAGLRRARGVRHRRASGGRRAAAKSRWAQRPDLASLRVRATVAGRLTFGRHARRFSRGSLLAGETRSSVLVLGPSQSGKTSGLAIPAILEWTGPVVATSVKSDLVRHTLGWRRSLGPAWVYDPTNSTGLPTSCWSPIDRCGDWQSARQVAAWLCAAARTRNSGMGDDEFWYGAAAKLLAPHLLAAAVDHRPISEVVRWIDTQEEDEVGQLLDRAGVAEAVRAAGASWERDDRTRDSIYATAEMVLEAFADPTVAASARLSEIHADELVNGRVATLYLCAPSHEQERLRPVFATLVHQVLTAAADRSSREGKPLDPPLLLVLDEAANIAPIRDLDGLASTAAGHGVQLVTVFQDLAQIQARYGERAATVLNNHRAKIVLSGVSDLPTLEYASKIIGDGDVGESSVTTDGRGARSTTRAYRERPLLTDAELRRIKPHEAVLLYSHLQPARLCLRPWFADALLRDRAQTPC